MYSFLQSVHSLTSYFVLVALAVAIANALAGYLKSRSFNEKDRKFSLAGLIFTHLQFIIGFVLYFLSPLGLKLLSADSMKISEIRLYTIEHPVMMILAVIIITIGFARAKRIQDDKKKFLSIWVSFAIGLLLILSRIPWQVWP